jgi:phage gp37-like protein
VKNAVLGILCPDIDARKKEILTRRLNSTLQSALNKFQELHLKVNGMLYPEADETHGNDFENGVANNKNKEYSLAEGQR